MNKLKLSKYLKIFENRRNLHSYIDYIAKNI